MSSYLFLIFVLPFSYIIPYLPSFFTKYNSYYVGNPNEKVIYLTFDSGYENGTTESILDTLKKHKVKAHFFVVESYIKNNPELIKRMVNEGHLVCNHSKNHLSMAQITDFEKFKSEIISVEKAYKEYYVGSEYSCCVLRGKDND